MIDLTGRVVLVTGASRGIGAACARLFAKAGADVALTCYSRIEAAEQVATEVRALGRKAWTGAGDHGDQATVDRLFAEAAKALGPLDSFVGNHGVWPVDEVPLKEMSSARWSDTMRANVDSIFYTTRAALRNMKPTGQVVLVGSTAGQRGESMHADYAASKGAMISLVKSLCVECAPGITVNCVAPGWVDTDMSAPAWPNGGRERIAATIPLRRIASAEDVAGPILFLCSPLGRHITGEILNVNGGSVLCG